MKYIILKAINGGYKFSETSIENKNSLVAEDVIDPLFWQALGKACGWARSHLANFADENMDEHKCNAYCINEWKQKALKFHEINLTEGWDKAVSWLSQLTSKQQEE